jgi:hypothetical protein
MIISIQLISKFAKISQLANNYAKISIRILSFNYSSN